MTISHPQYTRGGKDDEITGVLFGDKYIHLHPREYDASTRELETAATIRVKAKPRTTEAGFVNAGGYQVYHAQSLDIGDA
jgi:hypothetical protein